MKQARDCIDGFEIESNAVHTYNIFMYLSLYIYYRGVQYNHRWMVMQKVTEQQISNVNIISTMFFLLFFLSPSPLAIVRKAIYACMYSFSSVHKGPRTYRNFNVLFYSVVWSFFFHWFIHSLFLFFPLHLLLFFHFSSFTFFYSRFGFDLLRNN